MCARAASVTAAADASRAGGGFGPGRLSRRRNLSVPTITSAATNACRSSWSRSWSRRSASAAEAWQIGAVPPLPELMVLGELGAGRGRRPQRYRPRRGRTSPRQPPGRGGLRESRANRPRSQRGIAAARWRRRCGSTRIRDQADRSGGRRRAGRRQPVPFPAAVLERARRHPASISGALEAAPRGAAIGRR